MPKGNLNKNSKISKLRWVAASNAKFPFTQISRFKPKREKCLKGNLKGNLNLVFYTL